MTACYRDVATPFDGFGNGNRADTFPNNVGF